MKTTCLLLMKQKLYALDAFFIQKLKLSENDPGLKSVKIDNSFWKNVRDIWADLQDNPTTTPEEILSQPIWKNNHIKINRKPIFYKRWCKNGIFYLNDIIKNDGNFLTVEELNENFNMNVNFLDYLSIQNAIPREWRRSLLTYGKNLNIISNKNITILQELKKPSKASVTILADFGPEFNSPFRWRSIHQAKNHSAYH